MLFNNRTSTRSILTNTNNENASSIQRSKIAGANVVRKASFNENSVKTPHRNKDGGPLKGGQTQTTQRRRRALGDISNRKPSNSEVDGFKVGLTSKQKSQNNATQGSSKLAYSKGLIPSSSSKNRCIQGKFSKTPLAENLLVKKASGKGESGLENEKCKPNHQRQTKPLQPSSADYDGVYGITTRWSNFNLEEKVRSHSHLNADDDFHMVRNVREDIWEHRDKESEKRDAWQLKRCEERFEESIRAVEFVDKDGIDNLEGFDVSGNVLGENDWDDNFDLLDEKLPWEEEDANYEPYEDRRLLGSDPYNLLGDL